MYLSTRIIFVLGFSSVKKCMCVFPSWLSEICCKAHVFIPRPKDLNRLNLLLVICILTQVTFTIPILSKMALYNYRYFQNHILLIFFFLFIEFLVHFLSFVCFSENQGIPANISRFLQYLFLFALFAIRSRNKNQDSNN